MCIFLLKNTQMSRTQNSDSTLKYLNTYMFILYIKREINNIIYNTGLFQSHLSNRWFKN